jgi:hypothetical protein
MPLLTLLSDHRNAPDQWRLIVFAASLICSMWLWVAQKYHLFSDLSNSSRVSRPFFLKLNAMMYVLH